jgi:hypothetical protein
MMLVLGIAGLWTAGLLLVAGLCAAARRGDREPAVVEVPEPLAPVIAVRARETASPPVRAAA